MTIECVTLETNHLFDGNPLVEQHKLRYRSIIKRQDWPVPQIRDIEYDQYDNPAATYLIWRDHNGSARGVSRLYPTDRNFMLKEHFSHMLNYGSMPTGHHIYEGSRFCIDNEIDSKQRQKIAQELVLAYLEFGLHHGIEKYIEIMYPIYWNTLFTKVGWNPFWLGDAFETPDGKRSRAGSVIVDEETLLKVREATGIKTSVISYGKRSLQNVQAA